MKRLLLLFALAVTLSACHRTAPEIQSTIVFAQDSDSCHFYRIPAMCLNADGHIIAVTDRRYENINDLGYRNTSIDVSFKRSTDGGKSWSEQQFIARGDTSKLLGYGFGDASLTLTRSGKIVCLMACGEGNKGFRRGLRHTAASVSEDGGLSWSEPRIIPFPENLHSAFITSGKGVVDADGDLLLAACVLPQDYPDPMPVPWPVEPRLFYSKDEGQTWTLEPEPIAPHGDESKLELLQDGRLLISCRNGIYGPRIMNTAVKGQDGLWHWGEAHPSEGLEANSCNGDILRWKKGMIIHSYIKGKNARTGLTMAVSTDGGNSWTDFLTLQSGTAGYSTMVCFKNGDIGILYEDGSRSQDGGYDIVFSRIPRRLLSTSIRTALNGKN